MLGSSLADLRDHVRHMEDRLRTIRCVLKDLQDNASRCSERLKEAKRRMDLIDASGDNLDAEIAELKNKIAWAEVGQAKVAWARKRVEIEQQESELEHVVQGEAKKRAEIKTVREQLTVVEDARQEKTTDIKAKEEEKKDARRAFKVAQRKLLETGEDIKEMEMQVKAKEAEIGAIDDVMRESVERIRIRNETLTGGLRQEETELELQIVDVERLIEQVGGGISGQENIVLSTEMSVHQENGKVAEDGQAILDLEREIGEKSYELMEAKRERDQKRQLFAHRKGVLEAVAEIEKQAALWVGRKPLGPLRRFVKVKDPTWSSAVESILGDSLDAFIVTSLDDEDRLRNILKECKCRSSILRLGGSAMAFAEPDTPFTTVLSVLEFDEEIARNALVVNDLIEQIILARTIDEGKDLYARFGMKHPPDVVAIVTQEGLCIGSPKGGSLLSDAEPGLPRLIAGVSEPRTDIDAKVQESERFVENLYRTLDRFRSRRDSAQARRAKHQVRVCQFPMRWVNDNFDILN